MTDNVILAGENPSSGAQFSPVDWLDNNRGKVFGIIAIALAIIVAILFRIAPSATQDAPAKMPDVHCTIGKGGSLISCFGSNANAFNASMQFADRYGLQPYARLITTKPKPADAIKLDHGPGTDLVLVSVPMREGDHVVIPFDKDGNYLIGQAVYIHNGKVVQPVKR